MNIFFLDLDPKVCAQMHNSKHVVKMILEYSQLLSTAHRVLDGVEYIDLTSNGRKIKRWKLEDEREFHLMKATHINHPSAVWTRQSKINYTWLYALLNELLIEYTFRYGKIHSCEKIMSWLIDCPKNMPRTEWTEPAQAMPEDIRIKNDAVKAYRNYYINNKQHLASWDGKVNSRAAPSWWK